MRPIDGATGAGASTRGVRGGPAHTISDDDLPTRMLVFGVARHDGTILAADVFSVAEACHRSPEQVRSCLRRLVGEGLFARDGVGQQAVYRPTEAGLGALAAIGARARLAFVQDTERDGWDGRWHLVAFAIPEARRTARDALRDHLGRLGGAAIHNGLYVSPHPWDKDVLATAEALAVVEHVTLAVTDDLAVGGETEPTALAAQLWPLAELADRYQAFLDRWSAVLDRLGTMQRQHEQLPDSAFLPGALAMGLAFRACFDADPLLPAELLPRPWPGREARDLVVASRRVALRIRADGGRPALFATFHDLVDSLPPGDASGHAASDPARDDPATRRPRGGPS
jgi:phenylacetic acid degradation operon negative regulatory protein